MLKLDQLAKDEVGNILDYLSEPEQQNFKKSSPWIHSVFNNYYYSVQFEYKFGLYIYNMVNSTEVDFSLQATRKAYLDLLKKQLRPLKHYLSRAYVNKDKLFASLNYLLTQHPKLAFGLDFFTLKDRRPLIKLDRFSKGTTAQKWIAWLLEFNPDSKQAEKEYPALAKWHAVILLGLLNRRQIMPGNWFACLLYLQQAVVKEPKLLNVLEKISNPFARLCEKTLRNTQFWQQEYNLGELIAIPATGTPTVTKTTKIQILTAISKGRFQQVYGQNSLLIDKETQDLAFGLFIDDMTYLLAEDKIELEQGKAVRLTYVRYKDVIFTTITDKFWIKKAIERRGRLDNFDPYFKADRNIMLAAVVNQTDPLKIIPEIWCNDKEIVMQIVKQDGRALRSASSTLQADKQVVMQAVTKNGTVLQYAASELKDDFEVVLQAVKCKVSLKRPPDRRAMPNAWSLKIRDCKNFLIDKEPSALFYASARLKVAKEILATAAEWNGYSLFDIEMPRLAKPVALTPLINQEMVIAAITLGRLPIKHVEPNLQAELLQTREIVIQALNKGTVSFKDLPAALQQEEIALAAIKLNAEIFSRVPISWQKDKAFIYAAIQINGLVVDWLEPSQIKDKDLLKLIINKLPRMLFKLADELREDKEVVTWAINRDPLILLKVSDSLKNNIDLIKQVYRVNPYIIFEYSQEVQQQVLAASIEDRTVLPHPG